MKRSTAHMLDALASLSRARSAEDAALNARTFRLMEVLQILIAEEEGVSAVNDVPRLLVERMKGNGEGAR